MAIYNLYRKKPSNRPDVTSQLAGEVVRNRIKPVTQPDPRKAMNDPQAQVPQMAAGGAGGNLTAGAAPVRRPGTKIATDAVRPINPGTIEPVGGVTTDPNAPIGAPNTDFGTQTGGGGTGGGQTETKSNDQLIEEAIRKLLAGVPNSAEERAALQAQNATSEARAIQSVRARTGAGGMGLTGAAGALESQTRAETGRANTASLADFDRKQRQEAAERALSGIAADRANKVFGAEVGLYEAEADIDIDGDGMIGGKPVGGGLGDGDPETTWGGVTSGLIQQGTQQQLVDNAVPRDSQPAGTKQVFQGSGYTYYQKADGTGPYYRVRNKTVTG